MSNLCSCGIWPCRFFLLVEKVIVLAYSKEYLKVVSLAYINAVGCELRGFGDFVNRFLGAHGKGKELRNGAFIAGASIVAGCLVLVPMFGAIGAVLTKAISSIVYFLMMVFFYRRYTKNLQTAQIATKQGKEDWLV